MTKRRVTVYYRDIQRQHTRKLAILPSRPETRAECRGAARPCPFVGCRFHLFLEVTPAGSLKMPFGEDEDALWAMAETCSLDVAERGDHNMKKIGEYAGVTAARIQQEVSDALAKLRRWAEFEGLQLSDLLLPPSDGNNHETPAVLTDYLPGYVLTEETSDAAPLIEEGEES